LPIKRQWSFTSEAGPCLSTSPSSVRFLGNRSISLCPVQVLTTHPTV
jgi:hypothetical protein